MARKRAIMLTSNSFIKHTNTKGGFATSATSRPGPPIISDLNESSTTITNSENHSTAVRPSAPPHNDPQKANNLASQLGKRKAAELIPASSDTRLLGGEVKAVGGGSMAEPPTKRSRRSDMDMDTNDRGNKVDTRREDRDGERERKRERSLDRDRRDERDGRNRRRDRSRSRSPARGGRRGGRRGKSRSPSGRDARDVREKGGARNRSPPRGPRGRGTSPSRKPSGKAGAVQPQVPVKVEKMDIDTPDLDDVDAQSEYMQKVMGFAGFKTTKNTKVPGNDRLYGVRRETEIKARQYMNRPGGFNRPLSPGRS